MQLHFWELKFYFLGLLFPHNCFKADHSVLPRSKQKLSAERGGSSGARTAAAQPGRAAVARRGPARVLPQDATAETTPGVRAVPGATSRGPRAAAAVSDASPAELVTRIPCGPQGSRGAPHSGSLRSLRRHRGLHAESQRRFYGYLFSTDSNCRSLLTAP